MTVTKWIAQVVLGCLLAGSAFAQHVISAKSGLIHYTEGQVYLGDKSIDLKPGDYPDIKEGQQLRTAEGRVEVLLTPGVFLRLAENSEVKMLANKLTDTRVEITAGSVILEAGEVIKENSIELVVNGVSIEVRKQGLFRIDATNPPRIRVFDGEVAVVEAARPMTVKEGKQVVLTSVPVLEKFSKDDTDPFHRWAGRRSGYLAMANMSAANQMRENSVPWTVGGWYYSPYFGMFTYIPLNGRYRNYWNYAYYSPRTVAPPQPAPAAFNQDSFGGMNASSRGMQDMSGRSYSGGGNSSGGYQAPATSSSAPAASAPRTGGGEASRGGSGGRR